jgi:hypothetical protein
VIRKARAVWSDSGRSGNGDLSSDSGVLADTQYSLTLHASVPNLDQDTFARLAQDAEQK